VVDLGHGGAEPLGPFPLFDKNRVVLPSIDYIKYDHIFQLNHSPDTVFLVPAEYIHNNRMSSDPPVDLIVFGDLNDVGTRTYRQIHNCLAKIIIRNRQKGIPSLVVVRLNRIQIKKMDIHYITINVLRCLFFPIDIRLVRR
jgi:hypothetical protein